MIQHHTEMESMILPIDRPVNALVASPATPITRSDEAVWLGASQRLLLYLKAWPQPAEFKLEVAAEAMRMARAEEEPVTADQATKLVMKAANQIIQQRRKPPSGDFDTPGVNFRYTVLRPHPTIRRSHMLPADLDHTSLRQTFREWFQQSRMINFFRAPLHHLGLL